MKSFITSIFLIVIIVPVLCYYSDSGLKCLTCNENDPDWPAPCAVDQEPKTIQCTKLPDEREQICHITTNSEGIATRMGCSQTEYNIGSGCYYNARYNNGISTSDRVCTCRSDLCNNPKGLKCLVCKGTRKPTGGSINGVTLIGFDSDYKCIEGEIPTEKWCLVDEDHCFNRWTVTQTNIGCKKYHTDYGKVPDCFIDEGAKECVCRTDNCNFKFEHPTTAELAKIEKNKRNIADMKSPLFFLVFTVAVSILFSRCTILKF